VEKLGIRTILDKEVKEYLERLGLLASFESGNLFCFFCNIKINTENIGGIMRKNGNIVLFCNKPVCFNKAVEERNKLKK